MKTFNELYSKDIEDWLAQGDNKEPNEVWSVDLVMKYYGEWIKDEKTAIALMSEVDSLLRDAKVCFSNRLRELRELLISKYGFTCEDIIFTPNYKREITND